MFDMQKNYKEAMKNKKNFKLRVTDTKWKMVWYYFVSD
ncbi:hypothetical protein B4083_4817 [Bacillus cereus]|nr:hypothetical protein B4083_4817 [Bacillus cereus]